MAKTLDARKAGTTCTRCGQDRWPFRDWTEPHTCQRCTEVLRGSQHVVDPRRFCGRSCSAKWKMAQRPRQTVSERFWPKVDKNGPAADGLDSRLRGEHRMV